MSKLSVFAHFKIRSALPAPVQDALKKATGAGTIENIESLTKNGTLVAYEAHIKRGKKRSEIQVGPNGEKLKRPESMLSKLPVKDIHQIGTSSPEKGHKILCNCFNIS